MSCVTGAMPYLKMIVNILKPSNSMRNLDLPSSLLKQSIGISSSLKPFLSPLTVISVSISKPSDLRVMWLRKVFLKALKPV